MKSVALAVVCLTGLGAFAVAAVKRSAPPESSAFPAPVVAGNKADRLPVFTGSDSLTSADRVEVAYVQPVEQVPPARAGSAGRAEPAQQASRIISRHWHDPYDHKWKAASQKTAVRQQPKSRVADAAAKGGNQPAQCGADGIQSLLKKVNLLPQCP